MVKILGQHNKPKVLPICLTQFSSSIDIKIEIILNCYSILLNLNSQVSKIKASFYKNEISFGNSIVHRSKS